MRTLALAVLMLGGCDGQQLRHLEQCPEPLPNRDPLCDEDQRCQCLDSSTQTALCGVTCPQTCCGHFGVAPQR